MNAVEFVTADGKPAECEVAACGRCRKVWLSKDGAERCCTCSECGEYQDEKVEGYVGLHRACYAKADAARRQKEIDDAELVESHGGWVYCPGVGSGWQDGYFQSLQELMEAWESDEHEPGDVRPEFAFCCESFGPQTMDSSDVLERITEEMHEDAADNFSGVKELDEALSKFYELNKDVVSWTPDETRKVRIPWDILELLAEGGK